MPRLQTREGDRGGAGRETSMIPPIKSLTDKDRASRLPMQNPCGLYEQLLQASAYADSQMGQLAYAQASRDRAIEAANADLDKRRAAQTESKHWLDMYTRSNLALIEAQARIESMKLKIHVCDRHNQHFERCESAWCHPSSDNDPAKDGYVAALAAKPAAVDTTKPHWRCHCGAVAMPLTDDTYCACGDIYAEEWSYVDPAQATGTVGPAARVARPPAITDTQRLERCPHDRLNEDGVCRACGEDCSGCHS